MQVCVKEREMEPIRSSKHEHGDDVEVTRVWVHMERGKLESMEMMLK